MYASEKIGLNKKLICWEVFSNMLQRKGGNGKKEGITGKPCYVCSLFDYFMMNNIANGII